MILLNQPRWIPLLNAVGFSARTCRGEIWCQSTESMRSSCLQIIWNAKSVHHNHESTKFIVFFGGTQPKRRTHLIEVHYNWLLSCLWFILLLRNRTCKLKNSTLILLTHVSSFNGKMENGFTKSVLAVVMGCVAFTHIIQPEENIFFAIASCP